MKRVWIGLALLSTSWLWGLSHYHETSWFFWAVATLGGTLLFAGAPIILPRPAERVAAVLAVVPAIVFFNWPHRAGPLLIAAGLVLCAASIPRRWPRNLGLGAILAGSVLLVQSLTMMLYAGATAQSHELPRPLAHLVAAIVQFLGAKATLHGTTLTVRTVRAVHHLGATWELLLDPVTLCFLTGGITLLYLTRRGHRASGDPVPSRTQAMATFILVVMVWLPVRVAILTALFLHRDFRTEYNEPLMLTNQFWSTWLHLALLAGPVLLAAHIMRAPRSGMRPAPAGCGSWRAPLAVAGLAFVGVFLLTTAWLWDPTGARKSGRILVDEHHSRWEPTQRPYDANWYGPEAGYNYACIYDYCSHFYDISRLETAIDANALSDCDILMLKTPTIRYQDDEIAAIVRFVTDGGGLLLIGDHTNVFMMGTCLNDISRRFGFTFRHDCLWDIDKVGQQVYWPPSVPHPIVQNMPALDFATSCSIDPGTSYGRSVMQSAGLRSLPAAYHVGNFMPTVEDRADARYGAFIQLWTTQRGAGRVAAFTDSTIFSNFATFEPGKAELMLGMLEWLNHRAVRHDPRIGMAICGAILGAIALAAARRRAGAWLLVLAVAIAGGTCAGVTVRAVHAHRMPAPKEIRPYVQVVIDRTVCDSPLSRSGMIMGKANGFGVFERWILRLGYFTSRQQGTRVFEGDLLVLTYPNQTVGQEYREDLVQYVSAGGKVLLLDSPENTGSTANSLLYPFGLSVARGAPLSGALQVPQGWPSAQVTAASQITGGEPLVTLNGTPVAARANYGQGEVFVIGFGSRFSDANMGVTGEVIPDDNLRRLFDLEFSLLRTCVSELESSEGPERQ